MGFGRFGAIAAVLLLAGFSPAQAERSAASAALGAENHPQILARFGGEVPDSTLRDYVARVAGNIVAVSAQPDEDWFAPMHELPRKIKEWTDEMRSHTDMMFPDLRLPNG